MSCPQTFHYYSVSMSWTVKNSWQITFRTSHSQHIMVGQCLLLVSIDTWNSKSILLTNSEIIRLHRHLKHPSSRKLYEVKNHARPNQVEEATRQLLEKITKACETFRMFSDPAQRFRVLIPPSDIVFNRDVALDLM